MTQCTVTTDATGRRTESPELAMVEVRATGEGDTAAVARRAVRDRAATVRESLTEQGLPPDQVDTVELRVEDTSQAFDPDTDAPYRAVERLRVDCAPGVAREVVVAATDAGGTVSTVEFDLRENTRRRVEEDALDAAMERAREKAQRLASAEGLAVGGVREVTSREDEPGTSSIVDEALAAGGDIELRPEPVVVSETVAVVYELVEG